MDKGHAPDDMEGPRRLRRWAAPRLLAWFDEHRRDLPWRRCRDPYRIWVSEVMLQQTVVAAVVGHYERFLARFPTLGALAGAQEQEVLRLWEGLGYYRRARDLLRSARTLHERHGGTFPNSPDGLEGLPGMGQYTRNAVLSQAFGLRLPVVEANSQRVLSRLFGREAPPTEGPARRWLWRAAGEMMPAARAGDFNQAMMELGALVCTPAAPRCGECPLSTRCEAFRQGRQGEIPARPVRRAPTPVSEAAVVVRRGDKVLIVQRPATASRWAGLWEFPRGERLPEESAESAARRLALESGVQAEAGEPLTTIRHGVTRFAITLACVEADYRSGEFRPGNYSAGLWLPPEELASLPVSSPQRKLAKLVAARMRQGRLF